MDELSARAPKYQRIADELLKQAPTDQETDYQRKQHFSISSGLACRASPSRRFARPSAYSARKACWRASRASGRSSAPQDVFSGGRVGGTAGRGPMGSSSPRT